MSKLSIPEMSMKIFIKINGDTGLSELSIMTDGNLIQMPSNGEWEVSRVVRRGLFKKVFRSSGSLKITMRDGGEVKLLHDEEIR